MPRYDFFCPAGPGHIFEQVAGYDDAQVRCPDHHEVARRCAIQSGIGVIFKGDGFTRSVIVPDPPPPTSTAKLTTSERMEVLDDYAKATHRYDTETLPYKKEERNANRSS
jgi:predicted nucleic acid-binding Zn ribbon protein